MLSDIEGLKYLNYSCFSCSCEKTMRVRVCVCERVCECVCVLRCLLHSLFGGWCLENFYFLRASFVGIRAVQGPNVRVWWFRARLRAPGAWRPSDTCLLSKITSGLGFRVQATWRHFRETSFKKGFRVH